MEIEQQIATMAARTPAGVAVRMRLLAKWTSDGAPHRSGDGAAETLANDLVAEIERLAGVPS